MKTPLEVTAKVLFEVAKANPTLTIEVDDKVVGSVVQAAMAEAYQAGLEAADDTICEDFSWLDEGLRNDLHEAFKLAPNPYKGDGK